MLAVDLTARLRRARGDAEGGRQIDGAHEPSRRGPVDAQRKPAYVPCVNYMVVLCFVPFVVIAFYFTGIAIGLPVSST